MVVPKPPIIVVTIDSTEVQDDIIGDMIITRPTLLEGIAGIVFDLDNTDGQYAGDFAAHNVIDVKLNRKDAEEFTRFIGKLVRPEGIGHIAKNDYKLKIIGEGNGYQLITPPDYLTKKYVAEGGKVIMTDLVNLTSLGKMIDPANDCDSTHDFDFKNATPMQGLREVLVAAKDGAVIGFNGFVSEAGTVYIFKRGKYGGVGVDLTGTIRSYRTITDSHRIINFQTIYGAAKKCIPLNQEDWAESLTPADGDWTCTGQQAVDEAIYFTSPKSLKFTSNESYTQATFTLDNVIDCYKDYGFSNIAFVIKTEADYKGIFRVYIYDSTLSRRAIRHVGIGDKDEWNVINIPCGRYNREQWAEYGVELGAVQWNLVKQIRIRAFKKSNATASFWIDRIFFNNKRFVYTKQDAGSQSTYGVRKGKPIFDDQLDSDADCQKRAEQIVNDLANPYQTSKQLVVEGSKLFKPAYNQRVVLPFENIDHVYRIQQIQDVVNKIKWESKLDLAW